MKKRAAFVWALIAMTLATVGGAGVGPRAKCDNEKSKLCDGLVAVYEFEEGLASGSTPTYPDAVRRNSFSFGDLYEPNGIDVGAGSIQTGVENGKLGYGPGTFSPADLSPTAWYKADSITGLNDSDLIGTWNDSSGNGRTLSQANAGFKPKYKTGIVNGLPVVRIDGTDDYLDSASDLSNFITASAGTIFYVAKYNTGTADRAVVGNTTATHRIQHGGTNAGVKAMNNDGAADTATDTGATTQWHIGTWYHSGGSIYAGYSDTRISGMTSVVSGNTNGLTEDLYVGASGGGPFWNHDIAEVIFYNSALTETNRQKVETWLAAKYNIALSYSIALAPDADAAEFDGATQYLHTGLDGRGAGTLGGGYWSVAFWSYRDTDPATSGYQYIWSEKGKQNNGDRLGTDLYFFNNAGTVQFCARVYDAIALTSATACQNAGSLTTWTSYVATYRPRTVFGNGDLSVSVNGAAKTNTVISGNGGILTGVGSIIGRSANPADVGFYDGRLDQLTLAGIAWEQADINSFHNGGSGREFPFVGN